MKKLVMILGLVAVAVLADPYPSHSTVTYVIVPIADVTTNLLALVAEETLGTLQCTYTGTPRVVLKFFRYKMKTSPVPPLLPHDKPMSASALDHNEKRAAYPWAHKKTPILLQDYEQYSHSEILMELQKPEWRPITVVTNTP